MNGTAPGGGEKSTRTSIQTGTSLSVVTTVRSTMTQTPPQDIVPQRPQILPFTPQHLVVYLAMGKPIKRGEVAMPRVRDIGTLSEKWVRRASAATQDYQFGVQNPTVDWQQATVAAANAWQQGVQQAIQERRWENAVRATPTQKWQQAAVEKGAQRFAQGVQLARDEWARAWEPYRQVLEGLQLPPRGPRGDPNNIQRVQVVARQLHEARRRRVGAGR